MKNTKYVGYSESVTEVMFRRYGNGKVIALFPYDIGMGGNIKSYRRGKFGLSSLSLIELTKEATESEYFGLFDELNEQGYRLKVIDKVNHKRYISLMCFYNALSFLE